MLNIENKTKMNSNKRIKFYEKNSEKIKEKQRQYYEANKTQILETAKKQRIHCEVCKCDIRSSNISIH